MNDNRDKVDLLVKLIKGELTAADRQRVEAQIASDRSLADLYVIVRELHGTCDSLQATSAAAARKLAQKLYADFSRRRDNPGARTGVTVFDSRLMPLPEGVRPATVDTRRLKYRFEGMDIELSLYPLSPDSYELIGQIMQLPAAKSLRVKLQAGRQSFEVVPDQFYLFRFPRIPRLEYVLKVFEDDELLGTVDLEL